MKTTRDLTGIDCDDAACAGNYYTCGRCQKEIHRRIWQKMSEKDRAYDRYVDPVGAYTSGYSAGENPECTCHISPPCFHCINADDES